MKALYVVSDQKENQSAIPGVSEADLCRAIGKAAVAATRALGHEAKYFDPKKSYSIKPALSWDPDVVILIHVDATGKTSPQGVMGVECAHASRDTEWARSVIEVVAADWAGRSGGLPPTSAYGASATTSSATCTRSDTGASASCSNWATCSASPKPPFSRTTPREWGRPSPGPSALTSNPKEMTT